MPVGATLAAAGIGAAGAVGSAYISGKAAKKAAKSQEEAAREARSQFTPFTNTGKSAVLSLAQLYGLSPDGSGPSGSPFPQSSLDDFTRSPDYAFARDQGIDALERSAAARGQLRGGNLLRDLTQFGSGLATQNFGGYVGRLMQLAQIGQAGAAGSANATLAAGEAQASGIVGQANAINSGISGVSSAFNSGANNILLYDLMKGSSGTSFAPSPSSFSGGGLY